MGKNYDFGKIEQYWREYWQKNKTFKAENKSSKPKYYVLDMFPYPSGAGLHVGHPLGYIASDIVARYRRLKGFNVLHPMGYDAYGLPAEQYAIQTGQHPAITTEKNIARYREQLDKIGFSFDWDREVRTNSPEYYKWTQWVFIKLFNSYYCCNAGQPQGQERQAQTKQAEVSGQARPIEELINIFTKQGTENLQVAQSKNLQFTAQEWNAYSEQQKQEVLMNYRLAYLAETAVNWCAPLGTVLANDEVVNGLSVRGGHTVERKMMKQWSLRITAYAERLLQGLETLDWSESMKEMQRNWIGKSVGATMYFKFADTGTDTDASPETANHYGTDLQNTLEIFTTRPDTIFGVTFMVLSPEHPLAIKISTKEQLLKVSKYIAHAKNRTERERQADVNKVTGVFTGAYVIHPFTNEPVPVYISDYVLMGYGSGAIMAVPAHDSRDYRFAKHFNLPIIEVVSGGNIEEEAFEAKDGVLVNSDFLNGLKVKDAIAKAIEKIEGEKIGTSRTNYRLRDAIFSRQRYWGEPFPVYYKNGIPYTLDESELPLKLPEVNKYLPTEKGEPPLARAMNWQTAQGYPLETSTMPGFAGSSAYYLRYMDPHNNESLVGKDANEYWREVDLYLGGSEHATGHLIYSRFWNKFLFDIGKIVSDEPFHKMLNQGMIQGRSSFVYRLNRKAYNEYVHESGKALIEQIPQGVNIPVFISKNILDREKFTDPVHVDIHIVENDILDIEKFKQWQSDLSNAHFIVEEDGKYVCGWEIEKMSKSMYNVQNPDEIIEKYGADTLRMYEMFLGPIEQSKPWDTKGIEGVFRFLKKYWRLVTGESPAAGDNNSAQQTGAQPFDEADPTPQELKILHNLIRKTEEDINRFSFNTAVSSFMIAVNDLADINCRKRSIIEPLTILLAPFAPHIAEEVWSMLGHSETITYAQFPKYEEKYTAESTFEYPVSFNGKMRFTLSLPLEFDNAAIEKAVLNDERSAKWLENKSPKKVIIVPKRIINIVL
ncbi:MAG: leucine--tRNA ligase [Bacteroidales bacterium]|jgi:leucyl-tRNA synthetase|nr:leucine--tRNA ligase [Bacteroidales bacterium]